MTETSIETSGAPHRRRREGRRGGDAAAQARTIAQLPRRKVKRRFPAMAIVSADEVESIHQASLTVLEEIGMDFTLPEARDILAKAGAKIEGERVRFDRAMVEELIVTAPEDFTFHARNPENSFTVGGPAMTFGTVGSPPTAPISTMAAAPAITPITRTS